MGYVGLYLGRRNRKFTPWLLVGVNLGGTSKAVATAVRESVAANTDLPLKNIELFGSLFISSDNNILQANIFDLG